MNVIRTSGVPVHISCCQQKKRSQLRFDIYIDNFLMHLIFVRHAEGLRTLIEDEGKIKPIPESNLIHECKWRKICSLTVFFVMKWKRLLQSQKTTLVLYGICCLLIVQILYVSKSVRLVERENDSVLNAVDNQVLTSKGMYTYKLTFLLMTSK